MWGVVGQESEVQINGDVDNMITIPLSTMRKAYNLGTRVDMALIDVKSGHTPAELQPQIERIIRLSHPIHPDDKRAIMYMDISEEFDMIDKMFTGVDVLVLFVGFGSLLAGNHRRGQHHVDHRQGTHPGDRNTPSNRSKAA